MNFQDNTPYDILTEKWNPVLSHDALPVIEDDYRKKVTAVLLENQEQAIRSQHLTEDMTSNNLGMPTSFSNNGGVAGYDPVLISLVRRAMPNLMAYDICGVQPMTAPTGLIFAMRANYGGCLYTEQRAYAEAMFQEPQPGFGGSGYALPAGTTSFKGFSAGYGLCAGGSYQGGTFNNPAYLRQISAAEFSSFRGMLTSSGEGLGSGTGIYSQFNQMAFSIDRVAVQARTRALSSNYTIELAQDLKAVHGLDAEAELANLLSTEILAEINRELVRTVYYVARQGSTQYDLNGAGVYDLNIDSDGRWSAERFRGLTFQIERECNAIAKETRRGKGNFIICDSDTAAALAMSGFMSLSPGIAPQINGDDTQSTFAGILNGKIRVYIDPYSALGVNFFCAGYKGESPYDAGLFYCPYVPLQMVRAVDPNTFQPRIGFKTRYGVVANPYVLNPTAANGPVPDGENLTAGLNQYYRLTRVLNLHGNTFAY
jgi:hypothetical protein